MVRRLALDTAQPPRRFGRHRRGGRRAAHLPAPRARQRLRRRREVDAFLAEGRRMVRLLRGQDGGPLHPRQRGARLPRPLAGRRHRRPLGLRRALRRAAARSADRQAAAAVAGAHRVRDGHRLRRRPQALPERRRAPGLAPCHAARRLAAARLDLARHRRGMQLVNGNALVARLLRSAARPPASRCARRPPPCALLRERRPGVRRGGRAARGRARGGSAARRRARCRRLPARPGAASGDVRARRRAAARTIPPRRRRNTGDGLRLGEQVGGGWCDDFASPGAWAPVSPRAAARRHATRTSRT